MSRALASPFGITARGRSLLGILLLALLLPGLAARASSACADVLGDRIAAWLVAVVPSSVQPVDVASDEHAELPSDGPALVNNASFNEKGQAQPARARPARIMGLRVTSAQVLALAARRAIPHAVFVKGNGQRPAGLQLSGVSALGIGLQEGDVLTEAAGQKASSVAAVVGVVLAARARQASEISGRFYRGSVPFSLTVEQPYPKQPVPG